MEILLQRARARVQKKFLVSFCPLEMAGTFAENLQAGTSSGSFYLFDGLLLQGRIAHDSAFSHRIFLQFELRLHKNNELGSGPSGFDDSRKNLCDRNERDVDGDQIDWLADVFWAHVAGIALDSVHAWVSEQLPIELIDGHVDGVDSCGAVLQEAIGETAGRAAYIEADFSGGRDLEIVERAFELQTRAAGIAKSLADDFDLRVFGDLCAGLIGQGTSDADLACEQ